MKIRPEEFRVRPGQSVNLAQWATRVAPLYESKDGHEARMRRLVERLRELQDLHYADHTRALLVVVQGMDAAGKDTVIKQVMAGVNPQGSHVFSFKQPSAIDLGHDFLWRTYACLPARGHIGIFNRSYYEDVLVVRVHPEMLEAQGFTAKDVTKSFWHGRYQSMVEMERHLDRSRTQVVKVFLHVSREEQRDRLLARIDDPNKNWKFSLADVTERRLWKDYRKAYEQCLAATSTDFAPWYVVPADDKANTRLIVAQILIEALESVRLRPPKVSPAERAELLRIRKLLLD